MELIPVPRKDHIGIAKCRTRDEIVYKDVLKLLRKSSRRTDQATRSDRPARMTHGGPIGRLRPFHLTANVRGLAFRHRLSRFFRSSVHEM